MAKGLFDVFNSGVRREKKRTKMLKQQIQERKAYNRMQRGQSLGPAARRSAASFVAKGMPKPKYR
jgi:hypothetical protein